MGSNIYEHILRKSYSQFSAQTSIFSRAGVPSSKFIPSVLWNFQEYCALFCNFYFPVLLRKFIPTVKMGHCVPRFDVHCEFRQGFSGQDIYNFWLKSLYGTLFVTPTAIIYAIFDRELPHALLHSPSSIESTSNVLLQDAR